MLLIEWIDNCLILGLSLIYDGRAEKNRRKTFIQMENMIENEFLFLF